MQFINNAVSEWILEAIQRSDCENSKRNKALDKSYLKWRFEKLFSYLTRISKCATQLLFYISKEAVSAFLVTIGLSQTIDHACH